MQHPQLTVSPFQGTQAWSLASSPLLAFGDIAIRDILVIIIHDAGHDFKGQIHRSASAREKEGSCAFTQHSVAVSNGARHDAGGFRRAREQWVGWAMQVVRKAAVAADWLGFPLEVSALNTKVLAFTLASARGALQM